MDHSDHGFQEIEHTADLALHVWALDLPQLFIQAALGMNYLLAFNFDNNNKVEKTIELDAHDDESLLVNFLNEILYYAENDEIGFKTLDLLIGTGKLKALCKGAKIQDRNKDIKAATFHKLEIINQKGKYSVDLVFDV
jgi:SHS2 domain-containing protein